MPLAAWPFSKPLRRLPELVPRRGFAGVSASAATGKEPAAALRRRAPAALAGAVGLALVALGVWHSAAAFLALRQAPLLPAVQRGSVRDPDLLNDFIAGHLAAADWLDSGEIWFEIATAHVNRLQAFGATPELARDALLQAEGALERSLARKPANPYAWTQLAQVYLALGRDRTRKVGGVLRLAVLTGPVEPGLLSTQIRVALAAWPGLDGGTRSLFAERFALAMARDAGRFVELAALSGRVREAHRALGRVDRREQRRFEALVERIRPGALPDGTADGDAR